MGLFSQMPPFPNGLPPLRLIEPEREFPAGTPAVLVTQVMTTDTGLFQPGTAVTIEYDDGDGPDERLYYVKAVEDGRGVWVDRGAFRLDLPAITDVDAIEEWLDD